jgi:hypothetical protein
LLSKEPVHIIWKHSKKGAIYNRCAISIHPFGLCIYEEIANGTYKSVWYDSIENISYCVAEPLHRRIFAWIARSQYSNELECHVVLCKTRQQSRLLAELLAKTFYQTYRYRQQQQQILEMPTNSSTHCSVCDTIKRQQTNNHNHNHMEDKQRNDDYEHISFQAPMIARAYVRGYEDRSINSSSRRSRRSIDYDTTLADEESIKPFEYYRRESFYKE